MLVQRGTIAVVSPGIPSQSQLGPNAKYIDFGDALVLPGLVNSHAHLELSGLAGKIPSHPASTFTDWLQAMLRKRSQVTPADSATWWRNGALDSLRHGSTTIADIVSTHHLLHDLTPQPIPVRWRPFLELTGVLSNAEPAGLVRDAVQRIESLADRPFRIGLSPHAPYSTKAELLERVASTSRDIKCPVSIHIDESADESDMFRHQRGPLHDWLLPYRDSEPNTRESPVHRLNGLRALDSNLLAIHANYTDQDDIQTLGRLSVSVVHCPRSHAFFRHRPFPYDAMRQAGVNVCLGTDSAASLPVGDSSLSMFREMQRFRRTHPNTAVEDIVRMATVNGAHALGAHDVLGELRQGAAADFIVIPFRGKPNESWEAVVEHTGPVLAVFVGGQPVSGVDCPSAIEDRTSPANPRDDSL